MVLRVRMSMTLREVVRNRRPTARDVTADTHRMACAVRFVMAPPPPPPPYTPLPPLLVAAGVPLPPVALPRRALPSAVAEAAVPTDADGAGPSGSSVRPSKRSR